jgi:tetratricopeptide (TPR) repeat protein
MKTLFLTLLLAGMPEVGPETATTLPSPAQRRIEMAQTLLQQQPHRFQAENDLAFALISRARETADPSYYLQAQAAIARSSQIQPHNFEGDQAHVTLLLAEHRYSEALDEAKALNQTMPDSVVAWRFLAEAEEALGDYDDAAQSAQWMMNLRPGNVPGLLRSAALREDWGDIEGAEDLLNRALDATPAFETEQTASILSDLARLNRLIGRLDAADSLLKRALASFPDYYATLEELARLRMAQHRDAEAAELLQKRNLHFAAAQSMYLLALALERAGMNQDALSAFNRFEETARGLIDHPDNVNRELALYYAERGHRPAEALRIAKMEVDRRHDIATLDAYAWALYSNRQYGEARRQIEKAIAVGNREPSLLRHAAAISMALGDKDGAVVGLKQALDLNPPCAVPGCEAAAVGKPANPGTLR